ncbi:hypothetical protein PBY51_010464 [Eleginops maclovinus]|uniref:Uncharacterized protein n=1 Tax=Eleginops maclovinus TaxID=56733 RepID=A0AAN7X3Y8_ELEMC|nr:hypothetical protein PBY51_010464 [Eleginops maclovinus]
MENPEKYGSAGLSQTSSGILTESLRTARSDLAAICPRVSQRHTASNHRKYSLFTCVFRGKVNALPKKRGGRPVSPSHCDALRTVLPPSHTTNTTMGAAPRSPLLPLQARLWTLLRRCREDWLLKGFQNPGPGPPGVREGVPTSRGVSRERPGGTPGCTVDRAPM